MIVASAVASYSMSVSCAMIRNINLQGLSDVIPLILINSLALPNYIAEQA